VQLTATGCPNPEIGSRLFVSALSVQYHLSKVLTSWTSPRVATSTERCPGGSPEPLVTVAPGTLDLDQRQQGSD
jgi:hypothetical protein